MPPEVAEKACPLALGHPGVGPFSPLCSDNLADCIIWKLGVVLLGELFLWGWVVFCDMNREDWRASCARGAEWMVSVGLPRGDSAGTRDAAAEQPGGLTC